MAIFDLMYLTLDIDEIVLREIEESTLRGFKRVSLSAKTQRLNVKSRF